MARPPNPLFYLLATYVGFKISLAFLESEVDYKSHAVGVVLLFPLFSIIRPTWSIFYFVHGLLLRGLIVLIQRGHVPPGLLVYIVAPIALSLFLAVSLPARKVADKTTNRKDRPATSSFRSDASSTRWI